MYLLNVLIVALLVTTALAYVLRFLRTRACSGCTDQCRYSRAKGHCAASLEKKESIQTGQLKQEVWLRSLRPGQRAIIIEVKAEGELGRRIRDMGLLPGSPVEMLGRAPLRDPVALRVNGITLALRNREADHIRVEVGI